MERHLVRIIGLGTLSALSINGHRAESSEENVTYAKAGRMISSDDSARFGKISLDIV